MNEATEPQTPERRFLFKPANVRMDDPPAGIESPGVISGYAAVFFVEGNPDTEFELWPGPEGITERILPGAFDDIAGDDIRCLFNHNSDIILGRNVAETMTLTVDSVGLFFRCTLPNTTGGRDVAQSIDRGDVTGCSFQFDVVEQSWTEREDLPTIREVLKVRSYDVGPVTFPAYKATSVGVGARGATHARQEWESIKAERERDQRQAKRKAAKRRADRNHAHRSGT